MKKFNGKRIAALCLAAGFLAASVLCTNASAANTEVVAWGSNNYGQTSATAIENVKTVAAGGFFSTALMKDGTVVAWGSYNNDGQVNVPVELTNKSTARVIGISAGNLHTVVLKDNGTVVSWGNNSKGQGNVNGYSSIKAVSAGGEHTLLLKNDGTVLACGGNDYGQATVPSELTVQTTAKVKAIAAGGFHSIALREDGTVTAWGRNDSGAASVPAELKDATKAHVKAIAAGSAHSVALRVDGTVVVWGLNNLGQLNVPAELKDATKAHVKAIAVGSTHTLALREDETIVGWGANNNGQINIPAKKYREISAGDGFTLALVSDVPVITAQPVNVVQNVGQNAVFSVSAMNYNFGSLSYQWQKLSGSSWSNVYGATGATYKTNVLAASDNGSNYRCKVTNSKNGVVISVDSAAAVLSLNAIAQAPVIKTQPVSVTKIVGEKATLAVVAASTDGGTLSYQWERYSGLSWSGISGATAASWTTATLVEADNGVRFRCKVTNSRNNTIAIAYTGEAKVIVVKSSIAAKEPIISQQPVNTTRNIGEKAAFATAAKSVDAGSLSYQWQRYSGSSWYNLSGATVSSYTTGALVAGDNSARYRCLVMNTIGGNTAKTITSEAILTVNPAAKSPVVSKHPDNATKNIGENASFTVVAVSQDGGALSYQWQKLNGLSWVNLNGATAQTYVTGALVAVDNGSRYRCEISNNKNGTRASVNSNAATLSMNPGAMAPVINGHPASVTKNVGEKAGFGVVSTSPDNGQLSFQWQRFNGSAWANLPGATGTNYSTEVLSSADHGSRYRCEVSNIKNGTRTVALTNEAVVTMNAMAQVPLISLQPVGASKRPLEIVLLTITAASLDNGQLSYQWQKLDGAVWNNIIGATGTSYSAAPLTVADAGKPQRYRCVVSNYKNNTNAVMVSNEAAVEVILSEACDVTAWLSPADLSGTGLGVAKTVDYGTSQVAVNVTTSKDSTWKLYREPQCVNEISDLTMRLAVGENRVYVKVTAQNGVNTRTYEVFVRRLEKPVIPKETVFQISTSEFRGDYLNRMISPSNIGKVVAVGSAKGAGAIILKYAAKNMTFNDVIDLAGGTFKEQQVIAAQLKSKGYRKIQLSAGKNRFETAVKVAGLIKPVKGTRVVLVDGTKLPKDWATINVQCANKKYVILFVKKDTLTTPTANLLKKISPSTVYFIGSKSTNGKTALNELKNLFKGKNTGIVVGSAMSSKW